MTATVVPDRLVAAWAGRPGIAGFLTAVNHKQIGARFIVTACVFLGVGGVEALLMRGQLARPDATVLGPEAYNQAFTMHGTTMMFLFAVPVLEGIAMYVVPLMIGTRDMPFPRLNAFGYWTYLFGALLLHTSFLTGEVPDGGWFAYVPLTTKAFSPGSNLDFWLIGVTFVEVSGIVGAVELIVLILRHRAPGMALGRMPLFVWSVLVMSAMMLLAFPAVVAASLLLELQRKLGMPFFDPSEGGNPLLWQHLFWIFGHPEVYIMLLPASGIVSTVVAVGTRRPIVAYPLVVAALVTIAFLSFGLWVHHMFSVGIPVFALGLFAVASAAIAIPSGIQVFAWLATMLKGRPRWNTPMLFVVGFLLTFVAGGITGVMVAAVPFDWQAHDSFFVVAHFHYVLIGGVVFPIFGALHHWFPKMTGRVPSERGGKTAFWLTFTGFHVTFFPQHILGLLGMPRRVYTYPEAEGLGGYNLLSTAGSFLLGAGVVVFFANLAIAWRSGQRAPEDPWEAETFEWATSSPPPPQNFTRLPVAMGGGAEEHGATAGGGRLAQVLDDLASPPAPLREQVVTTWSAAVPQAVVGLSGVSYWPLVAAVAMAAGLAGLLVDASAVAAAGAVAAVAALVGWLNPKEAAKDVTTPRPLSEDGAPVTASTVWALVAGLAALGAVLGFLIYAYYYLALGEGPWPPPPHVRPTLGGSLVPTLVAVALAVTATRLVRTAGTALGPGSFVPAGLLGLVLLLLEIREAGALGLAFDESAYAAAALTLVGFAAAAAASAVIVTLVAGARLVPEGARTAAQVAGWVSVFAAVTWLAVWAVVHVSAQW